MTSTIMAITLMLGIGYLVYLETGIITAIMITFLWLLQTATNLRRHNDNS